MDKRQEYTDTFNRFNMEAPSGVVTPDLLRKLHYYETALHRLAETACNRDLTRHEDKRETSITGKVQELAKSLGFKVRFNHDPRGGTIRFVLPSGASNNWDGETWGIYW